MFLLYFQLPIYLVPEPVVHYLICLVCMCTLDGEESLFIQQYNGV